MNKPNIATNGSVNAHVFRFFNPRYKLIIVMMDIKTRIILNLPHVIHETATIILKKKNLHLNIMKVAKIITPLMNMSK